MKGNTINSYFKLLFFGLTMMVLINGCSGLVELTDRYISDQDEATSAMELLDAGMYDFNRGYYTQALESFQGIKDKYPYSPFAIEAELKIADTYYYKGEFELAYESYDEFEKLHPRNEKIPYVIYQKGMSHFRQMSTIDREQGHTLWAKEEFDRLIKRFPNSADAGRARKHARKCLISLAEYELYVGRFYFRTRRYRAALNRFVYLLEHYPDMGQYHEALDYINRCKEKIMEQEAEQAKEEMKKKKVKKKG